MTINTFAEVHTMFCYQMRKEKKTFQSSGIKAEAEFNGSPRDCQWEPQLAKCCFWHSPSRLQKRKPLAQKKEVLLVGRDWAIGTNSNKTVIGNRISDF